MGKKLKKKKNQIGNTECYYEALSHIFLLSRQGRGCCTYMILSLLQVSHPLVFVVELFHEIFFVVTVC